MGLIECLNKAKTLTTKKLRTLGDTSRNGPYSRIRPAKLTNHSARTNREI